MNIAGKYRYFYIALTMMLCDCGSNPVLVSSDTTDDRDSGEEGRADQTDMGLCQRNEDCSNGLFCDGEERCMEGACVAGEPPVCDDGDDCTVDSCSEEAAGCVFAIRDEDGDGFGDAACGGTDCNDSSNEVFPGAPESCEPGEDQDCSGTPDVDDDQDGYVDADCPSGNDCDDNDPDSFPGAPEVCLDGKDQDCDGIVDGPIFMIPNVKISDSGGSVSTNSTVWTGSEFGIAFEGGTRPMLYFARVNANGIVIEEEKPVMETGVSYRPSMVWTGSEYAIAFQNDGGMDAVNIYLLRLSDHGVKIGDETQLTDVPRTFAELIPSLVWTGSLFGMAWHRDTLDGTEWYSYIYFKRFDLSGVDVSNDIVLNEHDDGLNPQLAWTGSEFGILWNCHGICYSRVSSEGTLLSDPIWLTLQDYSIFHFARLEWTGTEYGIGWEDGRLDDRLYQTYFSRVSLEGAKEFDDLMICNPEYFDSEDPSIAWTGTGFGIVWVSSIECCGSFSPNLYFAHLGPDGTRLTGDIELAGASEGDFTPIDIVWTGSEFGVVWVWTPIDSRNGTYFNRIGFCD